MSDQEQHSTYTSYWICDKEGWKPCTKRGAEYNFKYFKNMVKKDEVKRAEIRVCTVNNETGRMIKMESKTVKT